MTKTLWLKSTLFVLASGTVLGLGYSGGCLAAMVQRILVDVALD